MVSITTERLELREFRMNDWLQVHVFNSDPEVVRYLGWGPNTKEQTKKFVREAISRQRDPLRKKYDLGIALKEKEELIGSCSIGIKEQEEGVIGICLNRSFWGKGYGTEAMRALINFGFEKLQLKRILTGVDKENVSSLHMVENVGMRKSSQALNHHSIKGKPREFFSYVIPNPRLDNQRS
jgi:ribosomal-protein-alanine N-acetyltransferase